MKRYFVIDENDGMDIFGADVPYATEDDAIREADLEWSHFTYREKKKRKFYVAYGELVDGQLDMEDYDVVKEYHL